MAEKEEDWDEELLVPAPGRMVYMGQGQMHYVHFHKGTPDPLWLSDVKDAHKIRQSDRKKYLGALCVI